MRFSPKSLDFFVVFNIDVSKNDTFIINRYMIGINIPFLVLKNNFFLSKFFFCWAGDGGDILRPCTFDLFGTSFFNCYFLLNILFYFLKTFNSCLLWFFYSIFFGLRFSSWMLLNRRRVSRAVER